jgi:hypothetical protein
MATDIGSLAPGPSVNVMRLGIGTRNYEKHGKLSQFFFFFFFWRTHFSIVESLAICIAKRALLFCLVPLT